MRRRWSLGKPIRVGDIELHLIWFDSLGAKSSCVLVETPNVRVLIDPGAAEMQPSYPLPEEEKFRLRDEAFNHILSASARADVIVITHYHYDHHTLPSEAPELYRGKTILAKNPNKWINDSQWGRARLFFEELYEFLGGSDAGEVYKESGEVEDVDPLDRLSRAASKDFGDYQGRRIELFEKGRRWLGKLKRKWSSEPWVKELELPGVRVRFADEERFEYGSTVIRFTEPMFHGIEYDRLGWVVGVVVEHGGRKVLYSSDVQGPAIEDYADWIIGERPDAVVLDGPPTYLFGFTLNRINLMRSIENASRVLHETRARPIIYDHHSLRDRLHRKRLRELYEDPEAHGRLMTAAEWLGLKPLIDVIGSHAKTSKA